MRHGPSCAPLLCRILRRRRLKGPLSGWAAGFPVSKTAFEEAMAQSIVDDGSEEYILDAETNETY